VGNTFLSSLFGIDNNMFYAITGTLDTTDMSYLVAPYHITAYDAYSGAARWSVRAPSELEDAMSRVRARDGLYPYSYYNASFTLGQDEEGKYLYIAVSFTPRYASDEAVPNKTFIFDKLTGAHVRTFDAAFGSCNRAVNNNIYSLQADGIYRYKPSGASERLFSGQISGEAALFAGKTRFFTQSPPYAYIGDFDPVTEKTTLTKLPEVAYNASNTSLGVDQTGAMLVRVLRPSAKYLTSLFFDKSARLLLEMPYDAIPIRDGEKKMTHAAYAISDYSQALYVYDLFTGKSVMKTIQSARDDRISGFALYGFDYGNGVVDVQIGVYSNDLGSGWGDSYFHIPGYTGLCAVNMRAETINFTRESTYLGYDDGRAEYAVASDSFYAVGWDLNSWNVPPPGNDQKVKMNTVPRTPDQILAKAAASLVTDEVREIKSVIVVENVGDRFGIGGAKFKTALGAASAAKLSDSGALSLVNSIVQNIASSELTTRKTAALKKSAGAAQGSISRTFTLDAQKTYYYEYEASSDDKDGVRFSASTVSTKPEADTGNLYVQKAYISNFGAGVASDFFGSQSTTRGIWYLASMGGTRTNDYYTPAAGSGSISFTVPKGSYGVLSFDWYAQSQAGSKDGAWFYVDGENVISIRPGVGRGNEGNTFGIQNSGSGSYVHRVLLGEGPHTLSGSAYYEYNGRTSLLSYAGVSGLKLEILDATPPPESKQSVKTEDVGGGFTRYTGSIETPSPVISYAPHPAHMYSGSPQGSPFFTGYVGHKYGRENNNSLMGFNIPANIRIFDHYMIMRTMMGYGAGTTYILPLSSAGESTAPTSNVYTQVESYLVRYASDNWAWSNLFFFDAAGTTAYTANEAYAGTNISYSFSSDIAKIRNFSLYYLENGVKTYLTRDSLESASEAAAWTTRDAALAVVDEKPTSEEKEKGALIYKKGQLVAYNIAYTDYENDPGKEEFWRYTHTPFNDGEHPDASTIMSRTGEVLKVTDKVLPANIDRFYIDGKYTVEHWQRDNTDRTAAGNGAVNYDDFNTLSNTESLTFYIEGGGEAPWVTAIKTHPDPVREGDAYKIEARVDDLEKDDLNVLIEVYYEGEKVYDYYKEGLKADEFGDYPPVITGFAPEAEIGDYTVVVTVWDEDGTGLGSHSFTVILEGRITGMVHHTDQWDDNRKSYNTKLFGEAYNRTSVFETYKAQKAPRKRGTNVFWSGERFMLEAAVGGEPLHVTCVIDGYPSYAVNMTSTGRKNADGDTIYTGSIWNEDMINKWGRNAPTPLKFIFTAFYDNDLTKTHEESVIVDMHEDYWRLHRYF
jgi:hypothetical protein